MALERPSRAEIGEWLKRMKQHRADEKELETAEDAPVGDPALVAKLAEVFSAETHLAGAVDSMRQFFIHRKPGEDFGLRLLDCTLWAQNLAWLLTQAQIIAKGEEK